MNGIPLRLLFVVLVLSLWGGCTSEPNGPQSIVWFTISSDQPEQLYPMITRLELVVDTTSEWVDGNGNVLTAESLAETPWTLEDRPWYDLHNELEQAINDPNEELVYNIDISNWERVDGSGNPVPPDDVALDPGANINENFFVWVEAWGEIGGTPRVIARTWRLGRLSTSYGHVYTVAIEHLNFTECFDGIDNDGDSWLDTEDPDCAADVQAPNLALGAYEMGYWGGCGAVGNTCNNNCDDDSDGWVDLADPDCQAASDDEVGFGTGGCNDGIDNDNDGTIDGGLPSVPPDPVIPADTDCTDPADDEVTPSCQNGTDDDGDGWIDGGDPDCVAGVGPMNEGLVVPANLYTSGQVLSSNFPPAGWPAGLLWDPLDNNGDGVYFPTQCSDGYDNDGDGSIDADDFECFQWSQNSEVSPVGECFDGTDNDGDGWYDSADPSCAVGIFEAGPCDDVFDSGGTVGQVAWPGETGCDSPNDPGEDAGTMSPACSDLVDNDGDGWIDGLDLGCPTGGTLGEMNPTTSPVDYIETIRTCNNHIDDDGDGWIDADDPGCSHGGDISEGPDFFSFACINTLDDDGDGWIDALDPGCVDGFDDDETDAGIYACSDGIDNDGDANIDRLDSGCYNGFDSSEDIAVPPECRDGIDNDGDGYVDTDDLGCPTGREVAAESADISLPGPPRFCSDGIDNDGDGWIDSVDPGCIGAWFWSETNSGVNECEDTIDNDGDGAIDGNDLECTSPSDNDESLP